MTQIIDATFEDGVFKPTRPILLPPRSHVRLTVELASDDSRDVRSGMEILESLWKNSSVYSSEPRLTREELHERR